MHYLRMRVVKPQFRAPSLGATNTPKIICTLGVFLQIAPNRRCLSRKIIDSLRKEWTVHANTVLNLLLRIKEFAKEKERAF
jgi:hypothetical protein